MSDDGLPDNDGYYQEVDYARFGDYDDDVDDARFGDYDDIVIKNISDANKKNHNELSWKDEKLVKLGEDCAPTKNGRIKYITERDKIFKERQEQYNKDIKEGTYDGLPDSKIFCKCKKCGGGFIAKKSDRKRGWARFCSKSCKASY